jgi:hypothetical protein
MMTTTYLGPNSNKPYGLLMMNNTLGSACEVDGTAVRDGSCGRLAVLAATMQTVRGSGPDGPRPGDGSSLFPTRCSDGLRSGVDGSGWRMVVLFSS